MNKPGWAPVKLNQTGLNAYLQLYSIYSCYNLGPIFGGSYNDLYIYSHNSYSNLGYTYSPPSGYSFGSNFADSFLAGSYHFNPEEVETVYDVAFTSQGKGSRMS